MSIDFNVTSYSNSSFDSLNSSSSGRTANEIARELIARSISKSSNISLVYKELLRSIIHAFSGFAVLDSESKIIDVTCIHAAPERAIAKLTEETNLILPIISVDQPTSARAEKRQRYHPTVVAEKHWDPVKKRAVRIVSLVPSPIDIEYEISVWSKYKNDLDQITEQIHSAFNPDMELVTSFATNIKLFIKEESTESNIVVADREDRLLKRVFKVFASTYVPSPKFIMTSTGQIEDFNYDVQLSAPIQRTTYPPSTNTQQITYPTAFVGDASSLLGSAIDISPVAGAALVYYGNSWAASETFLKAADIAELSAKVDSVEWGARYYRPDFVKLAYVNMYGSGEQGNEVEGQGSSDLWIGTSAYGEIARWFVPTIAIRSGGIMDIDITGYFNASDTPSVLNKKLIIEEKLISGLLFSGVNNQVVPTCYTLFSSVYGGSSTSDFLVTDGASSVRIKRAINGQGIMTAAAYAGLSLPSAAPYIQAGMVRTDPYSTPVRNTVVVYSKNRSSSALNQDSAFSVSTLATELRYPIVSNSSLMKLVDGVSPIQTSSVLDFTPSYHAIYKTSPSVSAAVLQTNPGPISVDAGSFLSLYVVNSSFSAGTTVAASASLIVFPTTSSYSVADFVTVINDNATVPLADIQLEAFEDGTRVGFRYIGSTDGFEFGILGDALASMGISPASGSNYVHSKFTKQDFFDMSPTGGSFTASLASSIVVFDLQVRDDAYYDVLDYSDLPYGITASDISYPVYDPSGNPFTSSPLGALNTSTLVSTTYLAPPSSFGLVGEATRGFPLPWSSVGLVIAGVSSFAAAYSPDKKYFDLNIRLRSGGFEGSLFSQPYTIELNQTSGESSVTKKILNVANIDFTKDKMMRLVFKSIQFSNEGTVQHFSDIPGPYVLKTLTSGEGIGNYYYSLVPEVVTLTTLAATLSCPTDGHPY